MDGVPRKARDLVLTNQGFDGKKAPRPSVVVNCCHGGPGGQPGFGGKVGLLAIGPGVQAGGTITTSYDHASLLRTTEDAMGISTYLNNAGSSTAMADLFQGGKG